MVRVRRVSVLGFRNLADGTAELGEGITLAWGPNGAGKTNLLEAVYVGLVGRSPRTASDREAIAFERPLARVEVETELDEGQPGPRDSHRFLWALERSGERRHIVDEREARPAPGELRPPIAVFMPDRLVLVKGPPAARRAHLDRFVAALWPARGETRRRYSRALAQRNALIARIRRGAAAPESLAAWDRELAIAGVELRDVRADACTRLAGPFATSAADLGLTGDAELRYRPRTAAADADRLAAELGERRDADLERGFTTHGPHLDDVELILAGRSMRRYASQGQQRIALLALLFAERALLLAAHRGPPLMLLDDVTSELDPERRALLCATLHEGGGQALITATDQAQLPRDCQRAEIALREGHLIASVGSEADAA